VDLVNSIDLDGNGQVEFNEFMVLLSTQVKGQGEGIRSAEQMIDDVLYLQHAKIEATKKLKVRVEHI
jgi:hypothetical protein